MLLLAAVEASFANDWTNTSLGDWFIGSNWKDGVPDANSTVLIENGGTALLNAPGATGADVFVGYFEPGSAGNGTLLMSSGGAGAAGSLTVKSFSLGRTYAGTPSQPISGTLNISNGASLTATGLRFEKTYGIAIGDGSNGGHGGSGYAVVSGAGSLLNATAGSIYLGNSDSAGTLLIEKGARAQSVGGAIGIGSATVTGPGSVWHSMPEMYVGTSGSPNSSLTIQDGGLVEATILEVFNGNVIVDNGSVTAPGLTLSGLLNRFVGNMAGNLIVGSTTMGRMEMRGGSRAASFRGYLGGNNGGIGSALLTDAGTLWTASGSIWIGNLGSGTLEILDGAKLTSGGNGYLAATSNTTGSVTVAGSSSAWTTKNNLFIGGDSAAPAGVGTLAVGNGATVSAAAITLWETGTLTVGADATLMGPLTAAGGSFETGGAITLPNDIILAAGGLYVTTYGFDSTFSGTISGMGGLTKGGSFTGSGPGVLRLTGNNTYLGPTTVSFGKLVVDGSLTSVVTVNSGTTLAGHGTVGGIIIKSGGNLAPGDSPGVLTVDGNYTQQSGGVLKVELGGSAPGTDGYDQVAVSGSASVAGTLNLTLVNGFRPVVGQTFTVIASNSASGNFGTINSSGFTVRSDVTAAGIVLTVTDVVPGVPVITSSTSAAGTQDQSFSYQITATESPTSFAASGLPPGLTVNSATGVISGTPTTIGSSDVTISATNSTATGSATLTITISAVPPPTPSPTPTPGRLGNISTRLRVETGDNVLIGGFIVTGTGLKKVILRGIGPSLQTGGAPVPGRLNDPSLELYRQGESVPIETNDNWGDASNKQEIIDSTVAPTNDVESAILRSLEPGAYTAIVRGTDGAAGVGLVEVFDLDTTAGSQLAQISTRGFVQTDENVMIGGLFVVGSTTQNVIVRAIGSSLPVDGKLLDPTLELFDGNGSIASNDNWRTGGQEQEIIDTTVSPTEDAESAIVASLPPGPYTAIVRGADQTTGIALVEVYALQ